MIEVSIASALNSLRSDIAASNIKGNVEGLLAQHIIGNDPRLQIEWSASCDEEWVRNKYDPSSLPSVAALGYTVSLRPDSEFEAVLEEGMQRAMARDLSMAGSGAALHDPAVLIGLTLAARALNPSKPQYLSWCIETIKGFSAAASIQFDPMLAYASWICGANIAEPSPDLNAPLNYCAALDWWADLNRGSRAAHISPQIRLELRTSIVERTLSEVVGHRTAHQAALLWLSLMRAVSAETKVLLTSPLTVSHLLKQFESCLRRWRWDANDLKSPVRWLIRSEREVQDILWMILRSLFVDLEDEDTLPKFGHSTYRADLGIPSLGLLIEVKFARSAADFKTIEKEVLEDIVPYLRSPERYREILIFIYDDSCSVQEHATTKQALLTVTGVSDVIIVSRPSHLPTVSGRQEFEKCINPEK